MRQLEDEQASRPGMTCAATIKINIIDLLSPNKCHLPLWDGNERPAMKEGIVNVGCRHAMTTAPDRQQFDEE